MYKVAKKIAKVIALTPVEARAELLHYIANELENKQQNFTSDLFRVAAHKLDKLYRGAQTVRIIH